MGKEPVLWDEAKALLNQMRASSKLRKPGTRGYFKVGKRNYTAFRVNEFHILRIFENLQHEGECITKLKLPKTWQSLNSQKKALKN